jgi:hypothetical protein
MCAKRTHPRQNIFRLASLALSMAEDDEVIDNLVMHRFKLPFGGEVEAAYCAIEDCRIVFTHIQAPFVFSDTATGPSSRGALPKRHVCAR